MPTGRNRASSAANRAASSCASACARAAFSAERPPIKPPIIEAPAPISAGIAMLFLLLQNYANPFVFLVVIFFAHVGKENLITFFNITHQRSRFINAAQIVVSYVRTVYFSTTSATLRTLKR
jgi:hypothetical protein